MKINATNKNFRIKEQDGMPREVATELLCTGSLRYNHERKTASLARSTIWESTLERKPADGKILRRLNRASLGQLVKWHRRAEHRYTGIQHKYQRVENSLADLPAKENLTPEQKKYVQAALEREKAKLILIGTQVEQFLMLAEDVLKARQREPKRREGLARTIFESMVIPWHKLVGVELHFDPQSLLA